MSHAHYYGHNYYPWHTHYRRQSTRVVYGNSCPTFIVKVGEIVDVTIDISDETCRSVAVLTATPTVYFVSSLDGSANLGTLSTSINPPGLHSIEVLVNAQDTNLRAGELWKYQVLVQLQDGRTFLRTFHVKIAGSCVHVGTPVVHVPVVVGGQVISGSGQSIPMVLSPGLFTITAPPLAAYATMQAQTGLVYTFTGQTPSDVNGIGIQVPPGTIIELVNANEIASLRFTGTNNGVNPVQAYFQFYTGDPNP